MALELPTFADLIQKNLLPIGRRIYLWRCDSIQPPAMLYKVIEILPDGVIIESIPKSRDPRDVRKNKEALTTLVILAEEGEKK